MSFPNCTAHLSEVPPFDPIAEIDRLHAVRLNQIALLWRRASHAEAQAARAQSLALDLLLSVDTLLIESLDEYERFSADFDRELAPQHAKLLEAFYRDDGQLRMLDDRRGF